MSTLLKSASKRQEATVAAATSSSSKGKGRLPTSNTTVALADEEDDDEEEDDVEMESDRSSKKRKLPTSDDLASGSAKKERKPRKDKVLLLSSRGTTGRMRHLINDLSVLLPHTKKDAKLDSKSSLHLLNELADLHSCNNTLYFEARRHEDLYAWMSRSPNGPSVKCHVQNVHTMDELKMTGNCLKGSRGLVCFDGGWEERIKNGEEQWAVMKELLTHTFSVPKTSRRIKPFIDHILTFSLLDNKIWFRNYQIIEKDPLQPSGPPVNALVEIGPRFVMTPIRIFEGSFGGPTVFENPEFISPAAARASVKRAQGEKYRHRKDMEADRTDRAQIRRDDLGEDELAVDKVFA